MDSATLQRKAHDIADQYLAAVPPTYSGRYSEIADPAVVAAIFQGIAAGLKDKHACEAAGISPRTFQTWCKRAETDPGTAYGAFFEELKAVRQQRKVRLLQRLEKAGELPQYWTANAWLLERTEQQEFALQKDKNDGPTVIFQVGVKDGDVTINQLSPPSVGRNTEQLGEGQ